MCIIDSSAPIFLASKVTSKFNTAKVTDKEPTSCKLKVPDGVIVEQRPTSIPKVENFKITHAKITEPHQFDSTWASGSQKLNGIAGTLSQTSKVKSQVIILVYIYKILCFCENIVIELKIIINIEPSPTITSNVANDQLARMDLTARRNIGAIKIKVNS